MSVSPCTTVLIRVACIPLTVMQQRNTAKLQLAKPEIEALNAVIKANPNDPEVQQQQLAEIKKIWAKYDCNPVKAFAPILLQAGTYTPPLFSST